MKENKYLQSVCENFCDSFYYGSGYGSGSGTVIKDGSGSDFLARYGSGSGSARQKVTVPLVKKLRFLRFRFRFHNAGNKRRKHARFSFEIQKKINFFICTK